MFSHVLTHHSRDTFFFPDHSMVVTIFIRELTSKLIGHAFNLHKVVPVKIKGVPHRVFSVDWNG